MKLIDNALDKLPYVQKLHRMIEELKAEVRARDEFGEKLIDENEQLVKARTELTTKLNKARDEFNDYRTKAEANLESERLGAEMWHKRWKDEHEKYLDLCEQLRESMEKLKDAANMVITTTMIDT